MWIPLSLTGLMSTVHSSVFMDTADAMELRKRGLPYLPSLIAPVLPPYTKSGGGMGDLRLRFGRLVAAHRRQAKKTQEQLAADADISVDMVGAIEAGKTGARFPTIERLAEALGVDPAELFTTDLPASATNRPRLFELSARLAGLSDRDLGWVDHLLDAALKPRS